MLITHKLFALAIHSIQTVGRAYPKITASILINFQYHVTTDRIGIVRIVNIMRKSACLGIKAVQSPSIGSIPNDPGLIDQKTFRTTTQAVWIVGIMHIVSHHTCSPIKSLDASQSWSAEPQCVQMVFINGPDVAACQTHRGIGVLSVIPKSFAAGVELVKPLCSSNPKDASFILENKPNQVTAKRVWIVGIMSIALDLAGIRIKFF